MAVAGAVTSSDMAVASSPMGLAMVVDAAVEMQVAESFPVQKTEEAGASPGEAAVAWERRPSVTGCSAGIDLETSLADFTGEKTGDPALVQAEEDSHDGLDMDLPAISWNWLGD